MPKAVSKYQNFKVHIPIQYAKLFEEKCVELKVTPYQFVKAAVEEKLFEESQKPKQQLQLTNDVGADSKQLAESEVTTEEIIKLIRDMDKKSKTKNSIKKTGAFHEENAVVDIKSMVNCAKPSFFELKYHFDWWYFMAVLVNALARRGVAMKGKVKQYYEAIEGKSPEPDYFGNAELSIRDIRSRMVRKPVGKI